MGEAIQFRKVTKRFAGNTVLDDINLDIPAGSVTVILGPSGSGKSTLLRCINRSEERRVGKECRSRWSPYH